MRQIAQYQSEGMIRCYFVVAIGDDEHRLDPADPSTEKFQQVQRSLIRPMNIFYDRYRWSLRLLQLLNDCREYGRARGLLFEQRKQLTLSLRSDVIQRTEWSRREQRIACAPEYSRLCAMPLGKSLDKCGLSDSRLAADKHDASAARGYSLEYSLQLIEEFS